MKKISRLFLLTIIFIITFSHNSICYTSEYWTVENIDTLIKSQEGLNDLTDKFSKDSEKLKADMPELYYYIQGMIGIINNDFKAAAGNLKEASIQAMANSERNTGLEAEALKKLVWIYNFYGESGGLIDSGSRLLELSEEYHSVELELQAYNAIALSYYYVANDEIAFEYLERLQYLAKTTGRVDYQGVYNTIMGHIYFSYYDFEVGREYYEKALGFLNEKNNYSMLIDMRLVNEAQLLLINSKLDTGNRNEDLKKIDSLIAEARKAFYNTTNLYELCLIKGQIQKEYELNSGTVESLNKGKEQLDKIKHIDTSLIKGAFIESLLAEAYYKNGDYKEAASLYASISERSQNPDYYKDVDETTSKLTNFQEKDLNSRIEMLTELQDAQNKKIQYQNLILGLLAFIIVILVWVFAIITRENKKINQLKNNLYQQSITDSLTGVFNRRKIWEDLNSENEDNNIVALVDIDNFKKINDTLGHLVGDEVLKKVVESIKGSVRERDEIGRYGGEEFIIILRDTDFNNALRVVERIREKVEALEWEYDELKTSISIGIAEKDNKKAEAIFKVVDELLQEAKNNGKNRVAYR